MKLKSLYLQNPQIEAMLSFEQVYANYMKNTGNNLKTRWLHFTKAFVYPETVLLLIVAGVFTYLAVVEPAETYKTIFFWIAAIAAGFGSAEWSKNLHRQQEAREIEKRAEHTVRALNVIAYNILIESEKDALSISQKQIVAGVLNVIDYWKEYYEYADTSMIAKHRHLNNRIEQESDAAKKQELEAERENLEFFFKERGVFSFTAASGSLG